MCSPSGCVMQIVFMPILAFILQTYSNKLSGDSNACLFKFRFRFKDPDSLLFENVVIKNSQLNMRMYISDTCH